MTNKILKYKTKNQIFNDFITLTAKALEEFGINNWQIRQLEQLFTVNILDPTIFIQIETKKQTGRQYRRKYHTDNYYRQNFTKQEVKIRFSATRHELEGDTLQTFNGMDVLDILRKYMQSENGIKFLANLGYAQYRAGEIAEQNFMNDSDDFQFLPYFDCTYLYTDIWQTEISKITRTKEKGIYHI